MFDGSSIAGWKAINESDMILMPDAATAVMDPFAAQPQLIVFCDIVEPSTGQPYSRDPRRSEEHTPELQSLMRISYVVFCLKQTNTLKTQLHNLSTTCYFKKLKNEYTITN